MTADALIAPRRSTIDTVISLSGAELAFGDRILWRGLDLELGRGEFVAVLGPNGSGKTSFLRVLLGQQRLNAGTLLIEGRPPRRGSALLGYIPQHRAMAPQTPLRGRDLIRLGLDGHRWGPGTRRTRPRVAELLAAVGATDYADVPLALLSGGELQRLRVAQALATDPAILLCDEPLLSLDLHHQKVVTELIDARRRSHDTTVVFVTHEINPILEKVDRVLYLAGGRFRFGAPEAVMTSETLSDLYGSPIDVVQINGRLVVVGAPGSVGHDGEPAP
ncbi:ABC transporter ATP-binding protein [Acrocarpospora phusangensis]|uniref:ABC transporter ATP-binding protein n=1 Tax=Acrocarpospora phusangensis TaxID=1070424 RepID=A0A919Q723_9ACTN|nr:ATP-binding cassette domain-containing protein [Acrocarpospora phusangensis]GIH23624.1 ABC transporter ATP-binding protein [Acrocarpospora phusangensis]